MTGRAARQHLSTSNLIVGFQLLSPFGIEITVLPLHVKDLGLRPDIFLGLAVTRDAPFHLERIFLVHSRHVVYLPVAGRTANAFCYVDAVIEIGILGQVVDALPLDGLIVTKTRPYRFQIRAICPQLAMTVHTRLCRRHAGRSGGFHRRVAISTINAVVTHMVLVAKLHGLLPFQISSR